MTRWAFLTSITNFGFLLFMNRYTQYPLYKSKYIVVTRVEQINDIKVFKNKKDFWRYYSDPSGNLLEKKFSTSSKLLTSDSYLNSDQTSLTLVKVFESEQAYNEYKIETANASCKEPEICKNLIYKLVEKKIV